MKPALEPNLSQGIKRSLMGHVGLVTFLLIQSLFFSHRQKPVIPSLRVDLVGLPDLLKKEKQGSQKNFHSDVSKILKKVEEDLNQATHSIAQLKRESPRDRSREGLKSREEKNKKALQRLKSLAKIQNWAETTNPTPKNKLIRGNRISKGYSLEGEETENPASLYQDQLRERLRENWQLPVWLGRQSLFAQVHLFIAASGELHHYVLESPSGNAQFDSAVKRAILASQPFPTPPSQLSDALMNRGVSVRFPL